MGYYAKPAKPCVLAILPNKHLLPVRMERGANHGHHETSVKIVNFHQYHCYRMDFLHARQKHFLKGQQLIPKTAKIAELEHKHPTVVFGWR